MISLTKWTDNYELAVRRQFAFFCKIVIHNAAYDYRLSHIEKRNPLEIYIEQTCMVTVCDENGWKQREVDESMKKVVSHKLFHLCKNEECDYELDVTEEFKKFNEIESNEE